MATFERAPANSSAESQQYQKFPLRRLEPAIQKFLKVIQIDLSRLQRHRLNVERFNRLQDWQSLHSEQINASRTVQQIKSNLQEIEKSRLQVQEDDLSKFDEKIETVKQSAAQAVEEFLELSSGKYRGGQSSSDSSPEDEQQPLTLGGQGHMTHSLINPQIQLQVLPENTRVAESWDSLQENLQDLNQTIHQYASLVQDQQESVDRIEDNIESAHTNVNQGVKQLGKAAKYKAVMYPVAGAIIGTVVGGPVGLVAGLKIGGLVGVAGGTVGFFGGKFIKKRNDRATDIELSNLSRTRTNSLPDISEASTARKSWFGWRRFRNNSESVACDSAYQTGGSVTDTDSWEKLDYTE